MHQPFQILANRSESPGIAHFPSMNFQNEIKVTAHMPMMNQLPNDGSVFAKSIMTLLSVGSSYGFSFRSVSSILAYTPLHATID